MFNKGGIEKKALVNVRQILANGHFVSLSAVIDNSLKDADGMVYAGRLLNGDLLNRLGGAAAFAAAAPASAAVLGFATLQITTAFVAAEKITIDGVDYTCASEEDIAGKKFAAGAGGTAIATQITSLLKMVKTDKWDVAAVDGATDKLGFTQKVVDVSASTKFPVVSKTSSTGVIGSVTEVTAPAEESGNNANCVLLHDVSFSGTADANATVVIHGTIQKDKLADGVQALYTASAIASLAARGIYVI